MLADNVVEFARVLRKGGMLIPPDRVALAIASLSRTGVERREDVHAALSSTLVDRHESQPFFDGAFELFWSDPALLERARLRLSPVVAGSRNRQEPPAQNRLQAAFAARTRTVEQPRKPRQQPQADARTTASPRQQFQRADFASMTPSELRLAQRLASEMPPPAEPIQMRRTKPDADGTVDLRRTLRDAARNLGALHPVRSSRTQAYPPMVALVDISGSMEIYTRVLLYYLHGLARRRKRLQVFTFGTVLTNVTRAMRDKDPDFAMQGVDRRVNDWRGGTRLRESLSAFNKVWSRRVLSGRATLLLVTDGLDGDGHGGFEQVMATLRRRSHRIVWLNPLLRFDGFQPLAPGVRVLARNADAMLPIHNLRSLRDLQVALRAFHGRLAG